MPKPDYGVQLHIPPRWEMEQTLHWAQGLGVGWVKHQVQWHTIEHGPDDFDWQNLDRVVDLYDKSGRYVPFEDRIESLLEWGS